MTITCSICKRVEDMRELTGPWAEDGVNDICPDCFPIFKEATDSLIQKYKDEKQDIIAELQETITGTKETEESKDIPKGDNIVSLFDGGDDGS